MIFGISTTKVVLFLMSNANPGGIDHKSYTSYNISDCTWHRTSFKSEISRSAISLALCTISKRKNCTMCSLAFQEFIIILPYSLLLYSPWALTFLWKCGTWNPQCRQFGELSEKTGWALTKNMCHNKSEYGII